VEEPHHRRAGEELVEKLRRLLLFSGGAEREGAHEDRTTERLRVGDLAPMR